MMDGTEALVLRPTETPVEAPIAIGMVGKYRTLLTPAFKKARLELDCQVSDGK